VQQLHQLTKVQQLHQLTKVQQLHQLTKAETEETVATLAETEETVATIAETETTAKIREERRIILSFFVLRITKRDYILKSS
jgi:hypothetical protein